MPLLRIYPPDANDDARLQMYQFDQSIIANNLRTLSLHVKLGHEGSPARSDRQKGEEKKTFDEEEKRSEGKRGSCLTSVGWGS